MLDVRVNLRTTAYKADMLPTKLLCSITSNVFNENFEHIYFLIFTTAEQMNRTAFLKTFIFIFEINTFTAKEGYLVMVLI